MTIDLSTDLENSLQAAVRSGHFASVTSFLTSPKQ